MQKNERQMSQTPTYRSNPGIIHLECARVYFAIDWVRGGVRDNCDEENTKVYSNNYLFKDILDEDNYE